MSGLRVVSFNAHDNFGRIVVHNDHRVPQGDIIVVPEAYREGDRYSRRALDAKQLLEKNSIYAVPYDDDDGRRDRHHLVMVANPEKVDYVEPIRLAGRTALRATLKNGIDVIGVHLDDRQEAMRRRQTQALIEHLDPSKMTIIVGDLNSMHRNDPRAVLLRGIGPFVEKLPKGEPGHPQTRLARIGSLATRLAMMAEGGALDMLERAGYHDADSSRQATLGFFQLDHLLLPEGMVAANFFVEPMHGLSDHNAIVADIVER